MLKIPLNDSKGGGSLRGVLPINQFQNKFKKNATPFEMAFPYRKFWIPIPYSM